jgi:hypothetical protein
LDEIGFDWDPFTTAWEDGFAALVRFKQRERHCNVPDKHKEGDHNLGVWVSHQRANKDDLSPERRQRMDEIGFDWDPFTTAWEDGFAALVRFKQRERHYNVPRRHKEGGYNLGAWVGTQRGDIDDRPGHGVLRPRRPP